MKYAIYLFAFAFIFTVAACGDDEASACVTDNITYTNTVKAIFADAGCANENCHPAGNSAQNFSLATYQDVKNFSRNDRMLGALRWQAGFQQMPRDSTSTASPPVGLKMLADCDIDKIAAWIADGRPE